MSGAKIMSQHAADQGLDLCSQRINHTNTNK